MRYGLRLALAGSLALGGCATAGPGGGGDLFGPQITGRALERKVAEAGAHPLGSERNPVRADMPPGQRAYLARLRCSDGRAPRFERGGSVGVGVYGNILDVYNVNCGEAAPGRVSVYMDMYHPGHVETRPVPGFTLDGAGAGAGAA